MENNEFVIIVAGGKGMRMGTDIPKQFLTVDGIPILMRTILGFRAYNDKMKIILVLPEHQQAYWNELCEKYSFHEPIQIANGGKTRFHSVKNGLDLIPDDTAGTVGVHDGVRPFASADTMRRTFGRAKKTGAAVPVIPVVSTLRHLYTKENRNGLTTSCPSDTSQTEGDLLSETVPRDEYRIVQTPQVFDIEVLKKAYRQEHCDSFTDDASVVEHAGFNVDLVEGNEENIKITTPFDITMAKAILENDPSFNHILP